MKIGATVAICIVCGAAIVGGVHAAHECNGGWCAQPANDVHDVPDIERDTSGVVRPEMVAMPPRVEWVPNNQMMNLPARGHPAFVDDNWWMNSGWLARSTG